MFIPRPAHIRCAIGETACLVRSIQANIFRSVLASFARRWWTGRFPNSAPRLGERVCLAPCTVRTNHN